MQYHLFYGREEEYDETRLLLNPQNLYRHMDLYANLNKPLQITEVTMRLNLSREPLFAEWPAV